MKMLTYNKVLFSNNFIYLKKNVVRTVFYFGFFLMKNIIYVKTIQTISSRIKRSLNVISFCYYSLKQSWMSINERKIIKFYLSAIKFY